MEKGAKSYTLNHHMHARGKIELLRINGVEIKVNSKFCKET